jgi:uncharacterized membrane protein YesL
MSLIWQILKKSAIDLWDEMLYLLLFNIIWVVGTVLIFPFPFVTFALFYIVQDVTDGKGINLGKFFSYGRKNWKLAYIWGGLNLVIVCLLLFNVIFYNRFAAQWAMLLQLFFLSVTFFWIILQLLALALYPSLATPGFKLASRNAAVLMGHHPVAVLFLILVIVVVLLLSVLIPILAMFIAISHIAVVVMVTTQKLLKIELDNSEPGRH